MEIKILQNLIEEILIPKIQRSKALERFTHTRAKFEGWLKVEIIEMLIEKGYDALPEINTIDVSFPNVGIELKTTNTNYRYAGVLNKNKAIKKNRESILDDIESLMYSTFKFKYVVFLVFPVEHDHPSWQSHLNIIKPYLSDIRYSQFKILNGHSMVFYIGRCK